MFLFLVVISCNHVHHTDNTKIQTSSGLPQNIFNSPTRACHQSMKGSSFWVSTPIKSEQLCPPFQAGFCSAVLGPQGGQSETGVKTNSFRQRVKTETAQRPCIIQISSFNLSKTKI